MGCPGRLIRPTFTAVMPIKRGSLNRNVISRKKKKKFWPSGLETRKSSLIQDVSIPSLPLGLSQLCNGLDVPRCRPQVLIKLGYKVAPSFYSASMTVLRTFRTDRTER